MTFPTLLVASFVNAGGQPVVVQKVLRARAQKLQEDPTVPSDVLQDAEAQAEQAEAPLREIARFQRELWLPIQPSVGLALTHVGPMPFDIEQLSYDMATRTFAAVEVLQLCHASGKCRCQRMVRAYMQDHRWKMISDIYAPSSAEDAPSGDG